MTFLEKAQKKIHDLLGWGYPLERVDGNYSCQFCDGKLACDSTGAWFHLSHYA
jgi:hypothetical protein